MSKRGKVPEKIIRVLTEEPGYVLVVTGRPGVGKTLFAQEIFRSMPSSFMVLTSSENSRVYEESLQELPDLESRMVTVEFQRPKRSSFVTKELDTLKGYLTSLIRKPIQLENAQAIIVDSWSDFIQPYLDKAGKGVAIEHDLTDKARNDGIGLILVVDEDDREMEGNLFHIADAIVRLEKVRDEERMYRRLVIEKMRGLPLEQDEFVFTLHGGRFTYIPWYRHKFPAITVEREPLEDLAQNRISTGSRALDNVIDGGFHRGALNLVEVDTLAAPYLETLYIPFLSNQLQLGRPAIILLPEGWSPERFTHGLTHFVDKKVVDDQVVFFGRQALTKMGNVRHIDEDAGETVQGMRYESNLLVRRFGQSAIEFFALDTLENKFGADVAKGMIAEITAALPETETATILILSRHQSIKSSALPHSVHIVVEQLCGVIGIFGVNPRTGILALVPQLSGGFLDYNLVPIV